MPRIPIETLENLNMEFLYNMSVLDDKKDLLEMYQSDLQTFRIGSYMYDICKENIKRTEKRIEELKQKLTEVGNKIDNWHKYNKSLLETIDI